MYSTNQASDLTGLSLRQIQWIDERGYVRAKVRSGKRDWSEEDIRALEIIAAFRAKRIATRIAARLVRDAGILEGYVIVYENERWQHCKTITELAQHLVSADQPVRVVEL